MNNTSVMTRMHYPYFLISEDTINFVTGTEGFSSFTALHAEMLFT